MYLFILMLSGGFYFLGTEFQNAGVLNPNNNGLLDRSLDMVHLRDSYAQNVTGLAQGQGFNTLFVFGDPLIGAGQFWNIISGGAVTIMEQKMSFPQSFETITQVVILGMPGAATMIYYLSNRA